MKPGGALAPRSPKRLAEADERWELCAEVKADARGRCQAAELVPDVECGGHLDVHERIPRSAWPGGHLVRANCLAICRRHHDWIGGHKTDAHALGLHGFSWERPNPPEEP